MVVEDVPVAWMVVVPDVVPVTLIALPCVEPESNTFVNVAIVYSYPNTC
jgi:hypothetical protein